MKYIFEIILLIIVIFFVWNIMKRLFFTSFYKFPTNADKQEANRNSEKEKLKDHKHGLNWDAETVDFEEVKEEKKQN